jgi:hypothetical protein
MVAARKAVFAGGYSYVLAASKVIRRRVGIPVKLNAHSERKPNGIPG